MTQHSLRSLRAGASMTASEGSFVSESYPIMKWLKDRQDFFATAALLVKFLIQLHSQLIVLTGS